MADYTKITRKGLDVARKQLKLPATIELLKRANGVNQGQYASNYTVDGGWLVYHLTEVVGGETSRFINLIFTDDRDDMTEAIVRDTIAVKLTVRGRTRIYSKKHIRPTIFGDPAYYQIGLDPTGEASTT